MRQSKTSGKKLGYLTKTMGLKILFSFFCSIGILLFAIVVNPPPTMAKDTAINCNAHNDACSQSSGDLTVTLEITPRPVKAMQDLVFKVSITGASPAKLPHIDLGMPAMKMGPNQVALKPAGPGTYEGTGVIVRCPSGKRTWFANVIVPEAGEVKFIFDVIY